MKEQKKAHLDFIVDKLTNSIQNAISGDSFSTEVTLFTLDDSKQVSKENGWNFNWESALDNDLNEVFKLSIVGNSAIIQGALSISKETDHIFINLLENAPFNVGRNKLYEGVAGNLVAYACKLSFEYGFDGFVGFTSKTNLIKHYEATLGANHLGAHRMIITTNASKKLMEKYFKI